MKKERIVVLETVSVIIPFQTDHGPRAEAFEWIKRYYSRVMPETELCCGTLNGEEVNKSKAVNLAAKKAARDILVIADADVIYDPEIIVESIRLLNNAAWVVPFTEIYDIEKAVTERLLKTEPRWPIDVNIKECTKANWIYDGFAGKVLVIPKRNFEAVGGFDERFIGWGGEDDAFSHAVKTLCGKFVNADRSIYHLWHPKPTNPNYSANIALYNRYLRASGNKEEMIKLINERKS
jgi:predicted glycosyltransferase involved in capsule biosynthesis